LVKNIELNQTGEKYSTRKCENSWDSSA